MMADIVPPSTHDARPAVVVNAAGKGTRLGLDRPKAMLEVAGRPLVAWQLAMLADVSDVRVVVGYRGEALSALVRSIRPDVTVVVNEDYASTGTAASLMRGARAGGGPVLSLDCDLIVHPDDLHRFLVHPLPLMGVLARQSIEPVMVRTTTAGGAITAHGFVTDGEGDHEWSGLTAFDPVTARLGDDRGHVFRLIEPMLPMPAMEVRAVEVDYPDELPAMDRWIRSLIEEGVLS